ncbi:MAG: hypothetical protein U0838_00565 [Chloroflexota bacterium]
MDTTRPGLDARELARLVRAHGGILGAIEYGVRSSEIDDPELATAWRQIERQYQSMRPGLSVVGRVLAKARAA